MERNYLNEPIEILDVHYIYIKVLLDAGIKTIGDLVRMPKNDVVSILNNVNSRGYPCVRRTLMYLGLVFDFDKELYAKFNIPDELVLVRIDELPLNQRIISALKNNGIFFLGDLLVMNYPELYALRRVGKLGIKEVINYAHDIGFSIQGERREFAEVVEDYKNAGIPLVGDVLNLSNQVVNPLYRAGIFTLDDFLEYGPNVLNLMGIGKNSAQEIMDAMEKKGIKFGMDCSCDTKEVSETILMSENIKNIEIKERLEKKKDLAREYQRLLLEREELLRKERELDRKFEQLIKAYKTLGVENGTGR